MKVLFVSYGFPPTATPGALRIYNFAKYLAKDSNFRVDVLYCSNYQSMTDSTRDWSFENIKLIPVSDPIPRKIVEVSRKETDKLKVSKTNPYKKKLMQLLKNLVLSDQSAFWGMNVLKQNPINKDYDFIISSYPTITNLLIGHYYSMVYKVPLIVDMRDLWTEDANFNSKNSFNKFVETKIEHRILNNAHKILTVSKFNAEQLSKKYGNRVEVIYNGFEDEKFLNTPWADSQTTNKEPDTKFQLAYAGSFYTGERDVSQLLKAIDALKQANIINTKNFSFDIFGKEEPYIVELINQYHLSDLVHLKGLVSQDRLFRALTNYDLLLVVTRNQPISKGELTTKLFEYIALGNPILCLAKPDFEIAQVLSDIEYTYCVDVEDNTAIEKKLKAILSEQSQVLVKRQFELRFSRDSMSEKLSQLLKNKVNQSS